MPWGEGPAKTYWPRGRYGENGKMAPMPEDARNRKMDAAMKKSVRAKRANLDFCTAQSENRHTADAEPVPPNHVQPAKSGGVFSALAVVGTLYSGKAPPRTIQGEASSSSGATPAPPIPTMPRPKGYNRKTAPTRGAGHRGKTSK